MSTCDDLAKALGLEVYDFAVPQPWYKAIYDLTGLNPFGHIVWCYDQYGTEAKCTFGYPVALTAQGRAMLGFYASTVR
jgi:hypothetical protein